jgi:hypothetical protein
LRARPPTTSLIARRRSRTVERRHGIGEAGDFITVDGLRARSGLNQYEVTKLLNGAGFPAPVATFGNDRVWHLRDVEAHVAWAGSAAAAALVAGCRLICDADDVDEAQRVGRLAAVTRRGFHRSS